MSNQKSPDSDYNPHEESEESSEYDSEEEVEEEESVEEILQDAQGWPEVAELEEYFSSASIPDSRKKAVKSLYNTFRMSQNDEDITSRSKSDVIKVLQLSSHAKKLGTKDHKKKVESVIGKCLELCPDKKKKRQNSADRKTTSTTSSTPTPSCSASISTCSASTSESVSILNPSSTAVVGVDISQETPRVEITKASKKSKKRKPVFEVAETASKKGKTDDDFFSPTSFNGFSIKSHPGILPRRSDKTPIDRQLDDWLAIDKDTKMAAFEKTWINDKSTNAVFVLRMLRRYKRKETGEGAVYTFDIPLENVPIMLDQLMELKNDFEKKHPNWFDEAMTKKKELINEIKQSDTENNERRKQLLREFD